VTASNVSGGSISCIDITATGPFIGTSGTFSNLLVTGDASIQGVLRVDNTSTAKNKIISLYDVSLEDPVTAIDFFGFGADALNLRFQTPALNGHSWFSGSNVTLTLDNTGNLTATGNVSAFSDSRLKNDVLRITDPLSKIQKIGGYTFTRKDLAQNVRYAGVIAQEVREVLPEVVQEEKNGFLSVSYGNMAALFVESIKELAAQVAELTEKVQTLASRP
jgi:hypothetical protein